MKGSLNVSSIPSCHSIGPPVCCYNSLLDAMQWLSPAVRSRGTWSDADVRAAVTGPYWDPLDADRLMHGLFIDGMF
jgi:hypothetical protein